MVFLVVPVVVVLGFLLIQIRPVIRVPVLVWMLFLGGGSSVAALVSSIWTPRSVRLLAVFAAAAWVVCFGLAFMGLSALAGLR